MGYYHKKPTQKRFIEACEVMKGDLSKIAAAFQVTRKTVREWCGKEEKFMEALDESRGKTLDECLARAKQLAMGIPKVEKKDGKQVIVGWIEKPDGYMLRYLIGKLGKDEGYAESLDVTSKGESIKPDPVVVEIIDKREQVNNDDKENNG